MDIKALKDIQIKQDIRLGFPVKFSNDEEKYNQLTKDLVGLFGEIGEFSNIVKKINIKNEREGYILNISEQEAFLKEEWVDSFIYLLRISAMLDIDIEKEVLIKMKYNKLRYGHDE